MKTIVWFRRDLRLSDNPALYHAASAGKVIPVFIHDPGADGPYPPGGASRWWLHHSLASLQRDICARNNNLIIRHGDTAETIIELCCQSGADKVYWNDCYEPTALALANRVTTALNAHGIEQKNFNGQLFYKPGTVLNKSAKPYRVFGAFWKACLQRGIPLEILTEPASMSTTDHRLESLSLEKLALLPSNPWHNKLKTSWNVGEAHAHEQLDAFCEDSIQTYTISRDYPAESATARLSPHLHFGEISVRQIAVRLEACVATNTEPGILKTGEHFLRQLGWREFAHHLLVHFPDTVREPFDLKYKAFPYINDQDALTAWKQGKTGFPIIDAGMRELWQTGSMHNRVRMIVASLLTKHAQIHWLDGARWFWDTLVDADLANNTMNWQWVAGCGVDAAPYFRIFNPIRQSEKFDPKGRYLRKWLPELSRLPHKHIHAPWLAPHSLLTETGIALGETYPRPILDLAAGRDQALTNYRRYIQRPIAQDDLMRLE